MLYVNMLVIVRSRVAAASGIIGSLSAVECDQVYESKSD